MPEEVEIARHPAKWTDELFPVIAELLQFPKKGKLIDNMAGTCKVVLLREHGFEGEIYCAEIEDPWAKQGNGLVHQADVVWVGDSRFLPYEDEFFDFFATSPTFANRMADHHKARDKSRRNTYKHAIGRDLTPGNTGMMGWLGKEGEEYRLTNRQIMQCLHRKLKPRARGVFEMKDHFRTLKTGGPQVRQYVTRWWLRMMQAISFIILDKVDVPVEGNRQGENHDARMEYTSLVLVEKGMRGVISAAEE
jgi:hypothetical protein